MLKSIEMPGQALVDKDQPEWLSFPEVQRLFSVIDPTFQVMRFVGGCVRNHLLGKPVSDFDLATSLLPSQIIDLLEKSHIKTVPLGLKHGSILAVIGNYSFEITTLRCDLETDGRHALVSYTQSWWEDAKRRDFTFNAFYLSMDGRLYDPWQGQDDLRQGLVRFIGQAETRVQEDYLRILRYFRFHAHYGHTYQDPESMAACQKYASFLHQLSAERIQNELIKLLQAPDPSRALQSMIATQVWPFVFRDISTPHLKNLERLIDLEQQNQIEPWPERRLALLLSHESPKKIAHFLKELRFSSKRSSQIEKLIYASHQVCKSVPELLYDHGPFITRQALLLQMARGYNTFLWDKIPTLWERPKFPLKGEHLAKLGIVPGPLWGKILHHVESWWVQQNFQPSAQSCWEKAQIYVKQLKDAINKE